MLKRQLWLALALLSALILAACVVQNAPAPTTAPRFTGALTEQLTSALIARDYAGLQELMDEEFRLANWNGEGRLMTPADAVQEIQVLYLEPAYALAMDGVDEAAILLGEDPLSYWSPEVEATDALVVRGLGVSGGDEAILVAARRSDGSVVWAGMIVAPGGFPTNETLAPPATTASANAASAETAPVAPIAAAQPLSVTRVLIVQTANVYSGPSATNEMVGLLSTGIAADVIEVSADGQWQRIICPPSVSGECWVSADPATARPVATPVAGPAPAAPPTLTSTPTALPATPTAPPATPTTLAESPPTPERISFAPGAVSAARSGSIQPGETRDYILRALAGQTMTIDLRSADMSANFAVTGVSDGQPYKRMVNEDRLWSMVIPVTQDYLISIMTTAPTDYSLSVLIPSAAATPTSTPAAPQRITFAPGASSATLTGTLPPNGEQSYLLRAVVGQTMFVALASPGDMANFSVSGYNSGQMLKPLSDPARSWSGRLPGTQDYLVTVVNSSGGSLGYTLVVSFSPLGRTPVPPISQPKRISFPSGGTSATVDGPIVSGSVQPFVLRALAGQTLQATVSSPASDVYLSVRGADGEIFLQFAEGQTTWSGVLPKNQDYLLSVYAAGGNTTFALTVTVE